MSVIITRLRFWVTVLGIPDKDLDASRSLREFRQTEPGKTMSQAA